VQGGFAKPGVGANLLWLARLVIAVPTSTYHHTRLVLLGVQSLVEVGSVLPLLDSAPPLPSNQNPPRSCTEYPQKHTGRGYNLGGAMYVCKQNRPQATRPTDSIGASEGSKLCSPTF